ncbi:ABC transporter ATP-binding protein [Alkalihalobacterium elongatum]|uniref:ABC transporter ATP-binding protein n=1 Tax=Alkalihalobacterium elongatum TaxID=2675466 RepID=UPI001C1FD34C|nr:ABC transporter ATP-binding protein [Alkalihalobacterium elongatum]
MPFFQVNNLSKSFQSDHVIKDTSFSLEEGRCVALLGPNGAGKTTILKMLAGLLKPTEGNITFEEFGTNDDFRNHIGYLSQYPVFHNWMSGQEFLEYAGKLCHLSREEAKERTAELIEMVGLYDAKDRRIGKYSGGMKQRLGIAQAIIHRPKLLLLDEPVSALDPFGRREVLEMIRQLKAHTTILFSTHVLNDAEEVSEDIIILSDGEIKVANSLSELRKQHQEAVIFIHTSEIAKPHLQYWGQFDFVKEMEFEHEQAKVIVADLNQAKRVFLQEIVTHDIPITSFELGKTTLEDLFVKVVKG